MNELYYEIQGANTYLVYEIKADDSIDSMGLGMLTNNKIHGLAQTLFTQMDNQKYIKFNVTAKVSVAQFFTGVVNKKRLLGVFTGIVNAMLAAEDYMLDPASIIMDMDYIFTDVSTCETELICLPIIETETKPTDLRIFFRNIMFSTQFDQTENCNHVAKIINYLNGTPAFSLNDFKKLLEEIQEQMTQPIAAKAKTQTASTQPVSPKKQHVANQLSADQTTKSQTIESKAPQASNMPPNSVVNGINVPPTTKKQPAQHSKSNESEITFFYLMQHYNKENAAAYKAQKEAKKRAAASKKAKASEQQPPTKNKKPNAPPVNTEFGFVVPGQAMPAIQSASPATQQVVPKQKPVPQTGSAHMQTNTTPMQQPAYIPIEVSQGQTMNFGDTTSLIKFEIGETTELSVIQNRNKAAIPHLIRKKNNENISLNKPVFRVGKERSYVDYFIGDNTAISRSHANFVTRDGAYFVVDTNSTNHTFVNGNMIQSNVETLIHPGDIIRLANEDFEFKI